ncbi:TrbI/VirB10 family protein [Orientia tsutsugamushi]|uniref:Conjugal transfer protein n=2 Tax=Orientia tsutsugamushi TaxID=784 RepID=A0A2U3R5I8_ORITS|nr:TrbI/VirB10 family protein [Orientia tsutsugamushi]KJV74355.1 bacterial conjugation TrbI-like family protein [Orientia tsutsugamushi str. UT76]SPR08473.1 conjugal transfer protein [Orientia tsutsugamushi]
MLLTGVVVGTGTNSSSSPEPIVLQLLDTAILYDKYKTDQIKKAILIGSCNGEIFSERATCRIETLSVVNKQGDIIEKQVECWLIGKDGRSGIKGIVVDKSSKVVRMAALNGVFSSIAKFLQAKAIKPDITTAPTLNIMTQGQV